MNGGLYFEVFNASGQIVTPWTLVNTVDPPSGNINGGSQFYTNPNNHADASENDYFQLQATSGGGFAIQWAENDEANGYFERFNSTGTATDTPVNYWNNVSGTLGDGFAVDTNGNIAIAIPTSEDVYTPSTFAIYNSNDTQILRETWQAADGTMLPVISNPGHSGVLPINSEGSPQFQALPGGEFLAVVTDPTGPWNVQNGYPGVDIYLQRISVSGSTVTFDTPVLIGENLDFHSSGHEERKHPAQHFHYRDAGLCNFGRIGIAVHDRRRCVLDTGNFDAAQFPVAKRRVDRKCRCG